MIESRTSENAIEEVIREPVRRFWEVSDNIGNLCFVERTYSRGDSLFENFKVPRRHYKFYNI